MIGIIQTSGRYRAVLWHYDGTALCYEAVARVTDYFGRLAKTGAVHRLTRGRRTCAPETVHEHLEGLALYWSAICYDGATLVGDFRSGQPTIYRYQGPEAGYPYQL
jgi:hypothetical protein